MEKNFKWIHCVAEDSRRLLLRCQRPKTLEDLSQVYEELCRILRIQVQPPGTNKATQSDSSTMPPPDLFDHDVAIFRKISELPTLKPAKAKDLRSVSRPSNSAQLDRSA